MRIQRLIGGVILLTAVLAVCGCHTWVRSVDVAPEVAKATPARPTGVPIAVVEHFDQKYPPERFQVHQPVVVQEAVPGDSQVQARAK